jgi:putative phage-type endonuclease
MLSFIEPDSDDMFDAQITISELIDDYVKDEILKMSSPGFHNELVNQISDILFEQWTSAEICEDTDEIYDEICDFVENVCNDYFENYDIPPRQYSITILNESRDCDAIQEKIKKLEATYQPDQRTAEWYEYRHNMITASNIWKVFASESQYNSLIYEKCLPFDNKTGSGYVNTESALHWGVKYEPVSIMMYELFNTTKIGDFGCIQHPVYKCIGASPDGIVVDPSSERFGHMVEIKNIVNREITGIPKEEYWIQMQLQLETCDLDSCDFIETRFREYENEWMFYNNIRRRKESVDIVVEKIDTATDVELELDFIDPVVNLTAVNLTAVNLTAVNLDPVVENSEDNEEQLPSEEETVINVEEPPFRGVICHFISKAFTSNVPKYVYMPLDTPIEKDVIDEWIKNQKEILKETHALFTVIYWYLDEYSCILVKRNRKWFEAAVPKIQEAWNTIEKERVTGYEHRATKKKRNEVVVETNADNNKVIKNLQVNNGICLIKLD